MSGGLLIAHPSGNANVRNAAAGLLEAGLLREFWTGIHWSGALDAWLPRRLTRELGRRRFDPSLRPYLRQAPGCEAVRLLAQRVGLSRWTSGEAAPFSPNGCHVALDRRVARRLGRLRGLGGVYAYDHAARDSFVRAGQLGLRRLYDLPIGHWRALRDVITEEVERQPQWCSSAPSLDFPDAVYSRKDDELRLADRIIVASTFTRRTLEAFPEPLAPVSVVPYGAPEPLAALPPAAARAQPLRVLYVGRIGLGKGIAYLLEAVGRLAGAVELTLLGSVDGVGAGALRELARHRMLAPRPHGEVLDEMARHDVFVFPSLFDGFGLVMLEAMSRGLPVIATTNSGGPDLIREGVDGFIVPIRDAEAMARHLAGLAEDRERLEQMRLAALAAAGRRSWEAYRRSLAAICAAEIGGAR